MVLMRSVLPSILGNTDSFSMFSLRSPDITPDIVFSSAAAVTYEVSISSSSTAVVSACTMTVCSNGYKSLSSPFISIEMQREDRQAAAVSQHRFKLSLLCILSGIRAVLPKEIVERIPSCMYLCHHFVQIGPELVYSYFLLGGNEYARSVFLCYPAVFELIQGVVLLFFRFE